MPRDLILVKEHLTLEQSLELFSKKTFNFRKKYYTIRLTGTYYPETIRQFVYLPFEIEIYDFLKIDRIVTGTENSVAEEKYLYKRLYSAKRHLHTHPPEGKIKYDTPSFSDYKLVVDGPKQMIIAHIDGMILFGHPEFDITGKKIKKYEPDDAEYMLDDYLSEKKLSWRKKNGHKAIYSLKPGKQRDYCRAYCELTGTIKKEVSWNNKNSASKLINMVFNQ